MYAKLLAFDLLDPVDRAEIEAIEWSESGVLGAEYIWLVAANCSDLASCILRNVSLIL